jgi:hypothetical protein
MNYKKVSVYLGEKDLVAIGIQCDYMHPDADGNLEEVRALFVYSESNPTLMYALDDVNKEGADLEDEDALGENYELLVNFSQEYFKLKLSRKRKAYFEEKNKKMFSYDVNASLQAVIAGLLEQSEAAFDYLNDVEEVKVHKANIKELQKDFVRLNGRNRKHTKDEIIGRLQVGFSDPDSDVRMSIQGNKVSVNVPIKGMELLTLGMRIKLYQNKYIGTPEIKHSFMFKGKSDKMDGNLRFYTVVDNALTYEAAVELNTRLFGIVEGILKDTVNINID